MSYSVKLYRLDNYNKSIKFIKNDFFEYNLSDAINELKTDKGYHIRLEKNKNYIFFGDCDEFNGSFNEFENALKNFLDKNYNIKIKKKDISYTENIGKNGSFHYSIPSLWCSNSKLKEIHENFSKTCEILIKKDKNDKIKNCVDVSIYTDKWFRMPNQTKEKKENTEHFIKRGIMRDFLVDFIHDNSININDKIFINKSIIKTKSNNKIKNTQKENIEEIKNEIITNEKNIDVEDYDINEKNNVNFNDVKEIITNLDKNRADNYNDWITVGMILKNISKENKFLDLWNEWSKNSSKYKLDECNKKWKSFNKKEKGYTIATLLSMLKDDNKKKFIELCKKLNIKNIIMERKTLFPKNDLEIDNIILNSNSHYIELADKFCPFIDGEHIKRLNYMEINKLGQLVLKCHCRECRGKEYPEDKLIKITENELKTIFNFTQNNYITINNINNKENDDNTEICTDKIKLEPNAKIFEDDELNKLILQSLCGSDSTISQVLFYLLKDKYYCSKEKIWYKFFNHKWIESEIIITYISDEFTKYYQNIITYIKNIKEISKSEKTASINEIKKIIKILQTKNKKSNIIEDLGVRLRINKPKFLDIMDTTPYLIGFNNGIYDLNDMIFREGKPEDMISMSCNYDFEPKYSKYKKNMLDFLEEILPVKEDREYFLTYLSSSLIGLNICELFTILTGNGRNGKSKLIDLIAHTLGDYVGRPKCKLLTGNRPDENSPEPGLLSLKKKRVILVSEPEQGDKLNSGFIKFITGNEEIMLRQFYKNKMKSYKANFITFLVCNEIPEIDNIDNAFTKRLRCINFHYPEIQNQKKIDEIMQNKLFLWKNDFMLLLLDYYKIFKENKMNFLNNKLQYLKIHKDVDIFYNFLNECTEFSEKNISNASLYLVFKKWFCKIHGDKFLPKNKIFLTEIKKYKTYSKSIWYEGKVTTGFKNLKIKNNIITY
jgi:putative DNA primase/helicase